MPRISSSELRVNQPITGTAPDATLIITMDAGRPLRVGSYVFQLQVFDQADNPSPPVTARLTIVDVTAPRAVISAPRTVPFNTEFTLSGAESEDADGGAIARYVWTLLG
jgi:hypothetical protein